MSNELGPVMTVFAGTNGAGKSTISLQMQEWIGEVVDPDQIAMRLNPNDPRSADLTAGKEAIRRIRALIAAKQNFTVETTLSGTFFLRNMQLAKARGYKVVLYYIGLRNVELHINRVASRVEQGGHWIAEKDIRWRYGHSLQNLKPAIETADHVILMDNTYVPEVIAEIRQNKMIYCVDKVPEWSENLIKRYR